MWPEVNQHYRKVLIWDGRDTRIEMRYAHIDVIQDEITTETCEEDRWKRWPKYIDVEGFTFDHFGTQRQAEWAATWLDKWRGFLSWQAKQGGLNQKLQFNPQPYEEVASYFRRIGAQDDSDQIRTMSRDLELNSYRRQCWSQHDGGACWHFARLGFLKLLVGYGIGYGLFWVLLPTIFFVLIGWLVLQSSEEAKNVDAGRGPLWCGIASLNKLIPGMNFTKEYADAFDDKDVLKLNSAQRTYFILHAIVGVILASVIVAALTGLTQAR